MQLPRQIFYSWRTLAIPALLLAPWGCQEQPRVSEYVVAPDANMTSGSTSGGSNADATPARTLAAAIYRPDATWFFKLMGNPEAVAGQQKNFETLLGSLGVDGKSGELAWKLPEGWTETKGQGLRFATLKPPGEPGLEVAVNRFEGVAGSLLANVNRWRGELGLADLKEDELKPVVTERKVGDLTVQAVDLAGTRKPRQAMAGMPGATPPMARARPTGNAAAAISGARDAAGKLSYKLPPGWRDSEKKVMFAARVIEVASAPGVRVTLSPLKPEGNSVPDNVNRWRSQMGLAPEEAGALEKGLAKIKLESGAEEALLVDITGKGPMGGEQRLLGAIIRRADALWFVKLTGEPTEVAGVREGFDNLVRSLKFE